VSAYVDVSALNKTNECGNEGQDVKDGQQEAPANVSPVHLPCFSFSPLESPDRGSFITCSRPDVGNKSQGNHLKCFINPSSKLSQIKQNFAKWPSNWPERTQS